MRRLSVSLLRSQAFSILRKIDCILVNMSTNEDSSSQSEPISEPPPHGEFNTQETPSEVPSTGDGSLGENLESIESTPTWLSDFDIDLGVDEFDKLSSWSHYQDSLTSDDLEHLLKDCGDLPFEDDIPTDKVMDVDIESQSTSISTQESISTLVVPSASSASCHFGECVPTLTIEVPCTSNSSVSHVAKLTFLCNQNCHLPTIQYTTIPPQANSEESQGAKNMTVRKRPSRVARSEKASGQNNINRRQIKSKTKKSPKRKPGRKRKDSDTKKQTKSNMKSSQQIKIKNEYGKICEKFGIKKDVKILLPQLPFPKKVHRTNNRRVAKLDHPTQ